MSKFKLKRIEIKSFRGIKNYILDFEDNKSLVLVGENGCGKSSIVNAFEFLFTGKVESLSGTQAIKHNESLVHIGDKKGDLLVKATVGKQEITRTLKNPPQRNDIIKDFENGSFLLNRQKLLSFIINTPKGRHERITSLIGFEELDKIENTFNKTQKSFKQKRDAKKEELENKITSITEILDCKPDQINDKLNELLLKHELDEVSNDSDLDNILNEISKNDLDKANQLSHLMKLFDADIYQINDEFEKLLNDYEEDTLNELKSINTLLDILNKSSHYIERENPENCPVCNKKINKEKVGKFIERKKKELNENENTLNNWKKQYKEFNNKLTSLNHTLKAIHKETSDLKEYEFNSNLDELIEDLSKLSKFEIPLSQINSNALIDLDSEFSKLKETIENDFEKLNNQENIEELNDIHQAAIKLKDKKEIESELDMLEKQYDLALETYETFKDEKLSKIEEIIENIENDVDRYYNFLHENEDFNTPEIEAPKSNSIKINLNFNEVKADPRSYSSEGHLDSLGLCIFLAFVKQFNKYDFIILDDIVSTVDLGHKERVAKLLFTEFRDYRFIITTHNKLWFRQLKNHADKNGLNSKFNFAEIKGLGSETGPILIPTLYSKDIINKHIENGDTFAAGNSIRRYLESVLENVCRTNRIKLPLTDHLMINDYFMGINKFFNELLDDEEIDLELKKYYKDVIAKVDANRYMGNISSHNDDDNCFVSISEIEEFRDIAFEFEQAMKCSKHKTKYLRFDKNTKIISCSRPDCDFMLSLKRK